jgi:hypothetical protein
LHQTIKSFAVFRFQRKLKFSNLKKHILKVKAVYLRMNSDFLSFTINLSTIVSFLPISVLLWYRKSLFQRSFGLAIFGYFITLFFAGVASYISAYLCKSAFPVFHVFVIINSFFVFLLFRKEYSNNNLKKATTFFLVLLLLSDIIEFSIKGGFLTNNTITYSLFNLLYILQYFLYLIDTMKQKPSIIYDRKSPFLILSITFFYALNQLLFSFIENDLRNLLLTNQYAILLWLLFGWFYIFYLIVVSYFLWKNLRS